MPLASKNPDDPSVKSPAGLSNDPRDFAVRHLIDLVSRDRGSLLFLIFVQ
jgi:hypothetical protein